MRHGLSTQQSIMRPLSSWSGLSRHHLVTTNSSLVIISSSRIHDALPPAPSPTVLSTWLTWRCCWLEPHVWAMDSTFCPQIHGSMAHIVHPFLVQRQVFDGLDAPRHFIRRIVVRVLNHLVIIWSSAISVLHRHRRLFPRPAGPRQALQNASFEHKVPRFW